MIKFFPTAVCRHPLLPTSVFAGAADYASLEDYLRDVLKWPEVREALYLSSPDFFAEVEKFLIGEMVNSRDPRRQSRFVTSALTYLNRMTHRSTPFGLFAGCGTLAITDEVADQSAVTTPKLERVARLDTAYLAHFALSLVTNEALQPLLRYFPNNTLYDCGDKGRYIEFADGKSVRDYHLSSFTRSEYTDALLERATVGGTLKEISQAIVGEEVSEQDALGFTRQLAEAKILISELEPHVVGENYQEQLRTVLRRWQEEATEAARTQVQSALAHLEALSETLREVNANPLGAYRRVDKLIRARHEASFSHQVQVDARAVGLPANLPFALGRQLQQGIKAMARLCDVYANTALADFRRRFSARYEEALVPILEVLDPELGIGYDQLGSERYTFAPLVDGVPVSRKLRAQTMTKINWDPHLHTFLLGKIQEAARTGATTIKLSDEDIEQFTYRLEKFPPTFTVMATVHPRPDAEPLLHFHEHGKDSAAALLARFSHVDPGVAELLRDITAFEDRCYPGKLLAEVNHLPELRMGNITQRPRVRQYEIPYVTKSDAMREEGMIAVQDIFVGIREGRIRLYSKRLGREIIPRVSNAHNYFTNSLPLYRFLASLQEEHDGGYYEFAL
ncbi:MAG: lantibiotic dehydratase family protein, partial [Bacteroidota bacterium]